MEFLIKIGHILSILLVIYLWNKFIVTTMIKVLARFHKKYNANNTNKRPFMFFIKNEKRIIKIGHYFYWFGGLLISVGILFN